MMHFLRRVFNISIFLLFGFSVLAQDNKKTFVDKENSFQLAASAGWMKMNSKTSLLVLQDSVNNKKQLDIDKFVYRSNQPPTLEEFSIDQLASFKKGKNGNGDVLNSSGFVQPGAIKWWFIDYTSSKGTRFRCYQTIYGNTKYNFYYDCPAVDFDKGMQDAGDALASFQFMNTVAATTVESKTKVADKNNNNASAVAQSSSAADKKPSLLDGTKAGTIAVDALKMEVDKMEDFFGKYAVVKKGPASALINDKGDMVIPYNIYTYEAVTDGYGNRTSPGITYYPQNYYGSLAPYRHDIQKIKLYQIARESIKGYLTMEGKVVFPKLMNFTGVYDPEGIKTFNVPKEGLLISERYDGTKITGKGYAKTVYKQGVAQGDARINYNYEEQYAMQGVSRVSTSSLDGWTEGLKPASSLEAPDNQNNRVGFINRKGEFQIKPAYYSVSEFSEGLSFVSKQDEFRQLTWGAIDTLGNLVIPYKFRMHPGRFSYGVAIVRTVNMDNLDLAFINKKGEVVFGLPKNSGDTLNVILQGISIDNPAVTNYDGFYFTEGYQVVTINFKKESNEKYNTFLMEANGHFIPIQKLIAEHLPAGTVTIFQYPYIKDGQFLFSFGNFDSPTKVGIADVHGNIILPPVFNSLSLFEKESNLQFAQYRKAPGRGDADTEGYIDRQGIFRIIKVKEKSGF